MEAEVGVEAFDKNTTIKEEDREAQRDRARDEK